MKKDCRILAFDTALQGCSVSFYDAGTQDVFHETAAMERGQAEQLVPMIERVMRAAGRKHADIDALCVTVGPGAFTGIRLAFSAARGMALALEIPVIGLTTFDVLAAQYFSGDKERTGSDLCFLLETKRSDYYAQFFARDEKPQSAPFVGVGASIMDMMKGKRITIAGDAAIRFHKEQEGAAAFSMAAGFELPDPRVMARLAAEIYVNTDDVTGLPPPQPLYLRGADVTQPKSEKRRIEQSLTSFSSS